MCGHDTQSYLRIHPCLLMNIHCQEKLGGVVAGQNLWEFESLVHSALLFFDIFPLGKTIP